MIWPSPYDIRHAEFVIDRGATAVTGRCTDPVTGVTTYSLSDRSEFYLKPRLGRPITVTGQRIDPMTGITSYNLSDGRTLDLKPQLGMPIVEIGEIFGRHVNHGIDLDAPGRDVDVLASTFTNPPLIIHLVKAT